MRNYFLIKGLSYFLGEKYAAAPVFPCNRIPESGRRFPQYWDDAAVATGPPARPGAEAPQRTKLGGQRMGRGSGAHTGVVTDCVRGGVPAAKPASAVPVQAELGYLPVERAPADIE